MMNRKMTLPLAAFAVSLGLLPAPVRAEDAPPPPPPQERPDRPQRPPMGGPRDGRMMPGLSEEERARLDELAKKVEQALGRLPGKPGRRDESRFESADRRELRSPAENRGRPRGKGAGPRQKAARKQGGRGRKTVAAHDPAARRTPAEAAARGQLPHGRSTGIRSSAARAAPGSAPTRKEAAKRGDRSAGFLRPTKANSFRNSMPGC